jgi:hypothetical protein
MSATCVAYKPDDPTWIPSSKLDAPVKLVGPVTTVTPVWAKVPVPMKRNAVKVKVVYAVRMVLKVLM